MRVLAGAIAGLLLGATIVRAPTHAQPSSGDVDRAKELYTSARVALDEGRHADAIRDFGASYDLTKDPVMFYWIGSANEKAGRCDVALIYYGRYLKEGRPSPQFLETVQQRVAACGGDPRNIGGPSEPAAGTASGSAVAPPGSGTNAEPAGTGAEVPDTGGEPAIPAQGSGTTVEAPVLRARHQGPWLLVGGSIAFVTIGAVLAYSADAAENDIDDLYVGLEGNPPIFDARTKKRYDELIAEGERYERLSWVSFALAGGLAAGAAVWFYLSREPDEAVVTPTVGKDGVGVTTTIRW